MDHATQVELTKLLFAHIDGGTTALTEDLTRIPVEAYAGPERLAREREVLFRDYPLLMGLSCQLPNPGDYLTDDHSGVPILIVRDADGGLGAFMNVCRHRGARVAEGCGTASGGFTCPYHAWNYNLGGKLVGIPHKKNFAGLDQAAHGLRELPAVEKDGLIWVRPSAGGPLDIDHHLGGLAPEIASYGFHDYHHYETRTIEQKFNWKIVIDTFLEPYHFGFLHKYTVGPIFIPNLCLFHPFGHNLRETLPRRSIESLRAEPESKWDLVKHTAIVYVLFPNTIFVMQADHAETWRVYPKGGRADECVMLLDFFIPEPASTDKARRHWDRNMDLTIRTVVEEDFATSEGIQRGFLSGAQDHVTFGRNEPALAHFEKAVAAAIA